MPEDPGRQRDRALDSFGAYKIASTPQWQSGLVATSTLVQAASCSMQGATTFLFNDQPSPGVVAQGSAAVWLAQCGISGGSGTNMPGAPGVLNLTSLPVRHWQCTVSGGTTTGSGPPIAPPFQGPALATTLLTTNAGVLPGPALTVVTRSDPGRLVLVVLSLALAPPTPLATVMPEVRFDPVTAVPWTFGVTGANGLHTSPTAVIGPAGIGHALWAHPLLLDGAGFVAGAPDAIQL